MQRVARQPDDAESAVKAPTHALFGSVQRRALRVGVYQRDPLSLPGPWSRKMQPERRHAVAAFLVEQ